MQFKRIGCAAMIFVLIFFCLSGCRTEAKEITCTDVMAAYEKAGYEVFHHESNAEEDEWNCYVKAQVKDGENYIFFHFFDGEDKAEAYAEKREWNVLLWFYSLISSQPTWLNTKTYGNIEYEYDQNALVKPFHELIK